MANPYPAVIITADGVIYRITGEITFTDPGNQPGGGGGGTVDSVTAGDASITIGGTAADPTVAVATSGITSAKLGTNSVTSGAITAQAVTAAKIGSGASLSGTLLTADGLGAASFQPPATVSSVTAGDTSIVIGGTGTAPTVETGTLDVIAADHPPAGNWSNNSHKITSLANGASAQDAAAFGQIPTALPPNGSAGGGLSGTYPNPTVAVVQAVAVSATPPSANQVLQASDATHAAWATLGAGSGTVTNVSSADSSIVVTNPTTTPSLHLGSLSTIAANEGGTVPVANIAAGSAGQYLGGTGPSYSYPPGYEINYTQITSPVSITDTSESTATALISPGAVTFDGGAVMVHFFSPFVKLGNADPADATTVTLFEGSTQIGRIVDVGDNNIPTGLGFTIGLTGFYRFTPSAGSHTYKVCAFVTSTTGTPQLGAGTPGTAAYVPAFVRFTKV